MSFFPTLTAAFPQCPSSPPPPPSHPALSPALTPRLARGPRSRRHPPLPLPACHCPAMPFPSPIRHRHRHCPLPRPRPLPCSAPSLPCRVLPAWPVPPPTLAWLRRAPPLLSTATALRPCLPICHLPPPCSATLLPRRILPAWPPPSTTVTAYHVAGVRDLVVEKLDLVPEKLDLAKTAQLHCEILALVAPPHRLAGRQIFFFFLNSPPVAVAK